MPQSTKEANEGIIHLRNGKSKKFCELKAGGEDELVRYLWYRRWHECPVKVLFVFIVLEHRRREVLHFNVTEHPSAAWTSQQIVEAFANQNTPRYLLRDRDRIYGNEVRLRIASLQIEQVLTAARGPLRSVVENAGPLFP